MCPFESELLLYWLIQVKSWIAKPFSFLQIILIAQSFSEVYLAFYDFMFKSFGKIFCILVLEPTKGSLIALSP